MKKLAVSVLFAAISACSVTVGPSTLSKYKEELISEVKNSDKITVVEHSNRFDFYNENITYLPETIKENVYGSSNLENINILLSALKSSDFKEVYSACIFSPHHRIEFYRSGVKTSEIEVCFQCEDIQWSKGGVIHGSLSNVFESTVKSAGFEINRDWKSIASEKGTLHGQ